jgi:hypothetical protein
MNKSLQWCSGILLTVMMGMLSSAMAAETEPLQYEVRFKGAVVAMQTVSLVGSSNLLTVTSTFKAELPVFVATHRYSETLSASFRPDGTVVRLKTLRGDGSERTDISGNLQADGILKVLRRDRQGITTNLIAREDYDFNSLILYGTAPNEFLPPHSPARMLQVAEGTVIPVEIQTISESSTFERQNVPTKHLVWKTGPFTSHSWHPERFSHLPRRYVRNTRNGEFTFILRR